MAVAAYAAMSATKTNETTIPVDRIYASTSVRRICHSDIHTVKAEVGQQLPCGPLAASVSAVGSEYRQAGDR